MVITEERLSNTPRKAWTRTMTSLHDPHRVLNSPV
uniref:Uncharacterized protein n=1 Tax=Arundo donax TaxID=35708 RepID=A0A0A9AFK1_ARUDO